MKMIPKARLLFNRRNNATKTKRASIEIEITYSGKRKFFPTGISVCKDQWNPTSYVVSHKSSAQYNRRLSLIMKSINDTFYKCAEEKLPFCFESISKIIDTPSGSEITMADLIEKTKVGKHLSEATMERYDVVKRDVISFGKFGSIDSITPELLEEYDAHVRAKKEKMCESSVYNYHKIIRTCFRWAVKKRLTENNPYKYFTVTRGKDPIRQHLILPEVAKLECARDLNRSLSKVRDLFLFQCYTSLAYADMQSLDYRTCIIDNNGRKVIVYNRTKTDETFYIVLLPKAIEILESYDYVLPKITNQAYNRALKRLSEAINLGKKITSHIGRHTFACIAINNGIPIEVVSRILGHARIETTQIYAKIVNTTIEKNFDILSDVFSRPQQIPAQQDSIATSYSGYTYSY